jgi:CheY-like chemotaxis protein
MQSLEVPYDKHTSGMRQNDEEPHCTIVTSEQKKEADLTERAPSGGKVLTERAPSGGKVVAIPNAGYSKCFSSQDLEVYNLLDHPIWILDGTATPILFWCNTAGLKLMQVPSIDAVSEVTLASFLHENFPQRLAEYVKDFQADADLRVNESWIMHGREDEQQQTLHVTLRGIMLTGGRMAVLVNGKFQDTIKTSNCECASLREASHLQNLPVPVSRFDDGGRTVYQNVESICTFGKAKDEAMRNTSQNAFVDLFNDEYFGWQLFQATLVYGTDYQGQALLNTVNGSRWFDVQVHRAVDPVTGLFRVIFSARDVSALQEAQTQADFANQAKNEFVAVMAHEIRTPLHQMLAFFELLAETPLTESQLEHVHAMESSAMSLRSTINDLLDCTSVEIDKLELSSASDFIARSARCKEQGTMAVYNNEQAHVVVPSLNVLVAEDNKVNQRIAVSMLTRLGHKATVVDNGLLAVKAVETSHYDLVLMDIQMPEMDGIEATQIIRSKGLMASKLPVIGLTASYRLSDHDSYRQCGMNDCLAKPVRLDDLRLTLKKAHDSRQHLLTESF